MMLRSAEADPHVIEHTTPSVAEAAVDAGEIAARCRCRSADAEADDQAPFGDWLNPRRSRGRAPVARPKAHVRLRGRGCGDSFALRLHPPKWADVRARRNLTEQPTSRHCSADESVVTSRRCQRPATRSFHGLCFPLQGPTSSAPSRRCHTEERLSAGPKPAFRAPRLSPVTASCRGFESMGSLRRFPLPACRRSGGRDGRRRGPKPYPVGRLFSAGAGALCRALTPACGRSRNWLPEQCLRSMSGINGRDLLIRDASLGPTTARRRLLFLGEPRGARH
jgi:hypothetical protein